MKKSILGVVSAVTIISIILVIQIPDSEKTKSENSQRYFHITLADPNLYKDGVFTDSFVAPAGDYRFRFIPNGDSPSKLSISLTGKSFSFSEDFELDGVAHNTGISEYYTWDYLGQKEIQIGEEQEIKIEINPNSDILGPVSVDLLQE